MSSSSERSTGSHNRSLHQEQASPDKPSPRSNPVTETLLSKSWRRSLASLGAASTNSSLHDAIELTTQSWKSELTPRVVNSSMQERSSEQSTKQTKYDTAVPVGQDRWGVKLHREPGKDVANYGLCDPAFSPTLGELISALEANPKQFPKKNGPLKECRAAPLKFKGNSFRAVFILNETARIVFILAIDSHDDAYDKAIRRC